jgi:hypothetical protein
VREAETIVSTAWSVSVTRSDAVLGVREWFCSYFVVGRWVFTVLLGVHWIERRMGRSDHLPSLCGKGNEKVVDFLEIGFLHR